MNVRDFLYNFVDPNTKILVQKTRKAEILFYGTAVSLDDTKVLNGIVESVDIEPGMNSLRISIRPTTSGAVYHLPEDIDFVY